MKQISILLFSILSFIISSCDKNEIDTTADNKLIISDELFKNASNDPLMISEAKIVGDSLIVSFGASCCDGNSWETSLIASSDIYFSDPPQRHMRLALKNNELCQAVCGKTMKFDIKPSRVVNVGEVILRLEGWQETLLYKY